MKKLFILQLFVVSTTLFAQENLTPVWISVAKNGTAVPKFKKMEWGFVFPKSITNEISSFLQDETKGLNPYDPQDIDLRITLTSPSGKSRELYGFFYQNFRAELNGKVGDADYQNQYALSETKEPWRFRFSPDEDGVWQAKIELYSRGKLVAQNNSPQSFTCVKSDHKGYLKISKTGEEKDRWMYYSETGEPFLGIAANITSAGELTTAPSAMKRQMDAVKQFIASGGNFVRFEVGAQSAVPDFPDHNNYTMKLDELYAFDQLISVCEDNNVYMILFRHHVETIERSWALAEWSKNPYRKDLGATYETYFTDQNEIKRWQLNSLRYQFARFGYSSNTAFYGFSEIDGWYSDMRITDKSKAEETRLAYLVKSWVEMQEKYIRSNLHNEHTLFMNTFASVEHLWKTEAGPSDYSDVTGLHTYQSEKKGQNYDDRFDYLQYAYKKGGKPVFYEEIGNSSEFINAHCCSSAEYHNDEWSSAFMGGTAIGMNWWWDRGIFDNNYQVELLSIKNFFLGEDLRAGNFSPYSWTDAGNSTKRLLENYSLVSENGERALGWIHNSTVYWRNLTDNQCLLNLINLQTDKSVPCIVAKDPYGYPNTGYTFPWSETSMYTYENVKGYDDAKYTDVYGKVVDINSTSEEKKKTFIIDGLKSEPLGRAHEWYRVDFYSTKPNQREMKAVEGMSQTLNTNLGGKLEIEVPFLDLNNPDYAYKVVYLGRYK